MNTTLSLLDPPTWNFVAITVHDSPNFLMSNVTVYLNTTKISPSFLFMFTVDDNEIPVIYLAGTNDMESSGSGLAAEMLFNGVMQDIGIYSRILTQYELAMLAAGQTAISDATFLPQCLCNEDDSQDIADSQLCADGSTR